MTALFPLLAAVLGPAPTPAGGAPDIRTIVPPQPYYIQSVSLWLVAAVVFLLLAGAVLWFLLRRPRQTISFALTPRQLAAQRLAELEAQMESLDARTFGGAVADVLRVYIGAQYGLHPERQTSDEFLASITGSRAFSTVEHALLTEFLESCDLLKFARAGATREGKRRLLGQARNFLDDSVEPTPVPAEAQSLTLGA